jgi:hypothetical protein
MNHCNIISHATAPSKPNQNQFVTLDSASTSDWTVEKKELVCNNAGVWQLTVQYQVLNINSVDTGLDARLIGWFNVNGKNIKDSSAVSYASKRDETAVLTLALSFEFQKGDKVKFGVRSESDTDPTKLNIVISDVSNGSGVLAPSLIVTALKAPNQVPDAIDEGTFGATGKVYFTNLKTGESREETQKIVLDITKIASGNFYCKFTELEPDQATFACVATPVGLRDRLIISGTNGVNKFNKISDDEIAVSWNFNYSAEEDQSAFLLFKRLVTK